MSDLAPLPHSFSRSDLETAGFIGWRTWGELRQSALVEVPITPAVYVVFRPSPGEAMFLVENPGGHFKGKDPTVPVEKLAAGWVAGCKVIYIGKAVQARRRLSEFARFGAGKPVGHWGGRYIWQLADSAELLVAWHAVSWDETARDYERRLLEHFAHLNDGARPFANLTG